MPLDLTGPRIVLAGTAYGECRGGGRVGMENVASCVMNRVDDGWASNVVAVCLAHAQFSCWFDVNRQAIEDAAEKDPITWETALDVADSALNGSLVNRIGAADSYYALSMRVAPFWAHQPARHVYSDHWHSFWAVRAKPSVPNVAVTADSLNAAQIARFTEA